MINGEMPDERTLDIVAFGEPTFLLLFAPLMENGAVNQSRVSEFTELIRKKDRRASTLATMLCRPFEAGGAYRCGHMNTVAAERVFFVLPGNWNASAVNPEDSASVDEMSERIDYFIEREFDGSLPLDTRRVHSFKEYAVCVIEVAVKLDDQEENLRKLISLSDLIS